MKKILKILVFSLLSLIIVVIAALFSTQTKQFKNYAKNRAILIINQNINGKIDIAQLEGTLFTNLQLEKIIITFENSDTLLFIEKLSLNYSLFAILKKELSVSSVVLDNPIIKLAVNEAGIWNFTTLFNDSKQDTSKTAKEILPLPIAINLESFKLNNGHITIRDTVDLIPDIIENLNIDLNGKYNLNNTLTASLNKLCFKTTNPNFWLKNLTFSIYFDNQKWIMRDFTLLTELNSIYASAEYTDIETISAHVELNEIETREFGFALPNIIIPANPDFKIAASKKEDNLSFGFSLGYADEMISISGSIADFVDLIENPELYNSDLNFGLKLVNFNPNTWIEIDDIPLVANIDLNINSKSLLPEKIKLKVDGSVTNSKWENILLETGNILAHYFDGIVDAEAEFSGDFGKIETKTKLDINSSDKPFIVNLFTDKLNLNKLLPETFENTEVSLSLFAEGNGLSPKNIDANFKSEIFNSTVENIDIERLIVDGNYNKGNIKLDTLKLINNSVDVCMSGFYNENGMLNANFKGNIYDTNAFNHYFENPVAWENLYLQGNIDGKIDSLNFNIYTYINQFNLDTTLSISQIKLKSEGKAVGKKIYANAESFLSTIETSSVKIDTTTLFGTLNDTLFDVGIKAKLEKDMKLALQATGNLGKNMELQLHQLNFDTPYSNLMLKDAPASVTYCDSVVTLKNLCIMNQKDDSFSLIANAYMSLLDSVVIDLSVNDFDLLLLSELELLDYPIVGKVNMNIKLDANQQNISLFGNSYISDLKLEPFDIQNIVIDFNFDRDTMLIHTALHNNKNDSLLLNFKTPLLAKMQDSIVVSWSEEVFANLFAEKLRMKNFLISDTDVQFDGIVDMNITVAGNILDPHINGNISLTQGKLPLPKYGIDYRDILLKLSLDDTHIGVDSLFVRHLKGTLLAQGNIELDSVITSPKIKSADVTLNADKFYVSNHRNHEIEIDAALFLQSVKDVVFGGKITILRAGINLPVILGMASSSTLEDPLLVQALRVPEMQPADMDSLYFFPDSIVLQHKTPSVMKQMTGSIKIEMPRNIWLKSDDMQIELFGNIDAVKSGNDLELFGTLGVRRGFYILYGKKLNIETGEITFSGGTEFNPDLNLKAIYIFRSHKHEKHELTLSITGKILDPQFDFLLDKQSITEADAVSYLIFGQSFDELGHGNQENISGNLPSKVLTGMLSSQLSKTLGNRLNIDMIEIEAADNWQNAAFMVGKYITNDLFVTYKNSFGQSQSEEIAHETISLEYEFTRRLSLRLMKGNAKETGIDFIVKFEK